MKHNSKIYIAGHKGLVGSAILKELQEKGYRNLIYRSHNELDLANSEEVKAFFEKERPEYVFLAAAKVGGIEANNTYRADYIYENLMIQNNVIHQSFKTEVKKLLFLGSTCIYPKNCSQPMKEDSLLTGPLEYTNEPYAIAKIAGIKMCESYNLQYNTNFISLMPTNLYGPNDNFDLKKSHVLPALVRKMHLGKALEEGNWNLIREDLLKRPIEGIDSSSNENEIIEVLNSFGIEKTYERNVTVTIWGTGTPKREFLYSQNLGEACVYVMKNVDFPDLLNQNLEQTKAEVRNTHLNIGTGEDISIEQLAILIKSKIGFEGNLIFDTSKPDGTPRKLTDVSKINSLGWRHSIELPEGVEKLYDWYLQDTHNK
ncbi:GDP-L-fucose synthase family protein [Christiangramia sp. LLG6405-1]|uniref:GDP-L-fucose synthase family protein n=1 Tax=Christiangramia sp. LLG6405-1 TaxID=3160832 RepID=UPI00386A1128